MARVFEARYYGRCAACDERITPGDEVAYDDDALVHEDCHSDPFGVDEWDGG
jgi:hypothetical protein